MRRLRYFLVAVAAVTLWAAWVRPATCRAQEDEQPLIELLQSDAPKADKAITCKKLAIWGSAKAVPALAALLPDPELTSWARIALEAIPDQAADEALRQALDQVDGLTLVGVINSIGVRGDAAAVEALQKQLQAGDAEVASAAAVALGSIGNEAATTILRQALTDVPAAVRSAVAEGCILCAERLLADGSADAAAALYDQVRAAELPKQRVVEATRGAILARGADGIPLLMEQLKSSDKDFVALGLTVARELNGSGVSKQLVNSLADVAVDLQAMLILALADRGDAEVMPAMLEAAQSGPTAIRRAALEVLKSIGDASCIPVLLSAAAEEDEELAQTALNSLKDLPGDDVNAALLASLDSAKDAQRIALLELIGLRRIDAVPPLLKAVEEEDPAVRAAALYALGEVAKLEDVSVLIQRVVDPPHAEDADVALQALQAACIRMPDREACAQKLADALPQASASAKDAILGTLKGMGGKKALDTVGQAAQADDAQLQDTATRLLGDWMSVDAGPVLLDLAKDPGSRYKVRALRGYLRLVRQFQMPDAQRAEMCRAAWDAAERDAERKLVLEAVERYPSVEMLRVAVGLAKDPALKEDATAVAMSVAQKISGSADVAQLLKQIDQQPVKIEIIKAEYGAGNTQKDVTEILRQHVRDFPLIVLPGNSYNAAFGGDPVPSTVKQLKVQYRMDGKTGEAVFSENAPILLPAPK